MDRLKLKQIQDNSLSKKQSQGIVFKVKSLWVKEPADTPLVICMPGPLSYASDKAIPYRYNPTILENGREIPIPPLASMSNIVGSSKVLRSGRILPDQNFPQNPETTVILGACRTDSMKVSTLRF